MEIFWSLPTSRNGRCLSTDVGARHAETIGSMVGRRRKGGA